MTAPRAAVRRLALARLISVTGSAAAYTALMFEIYDQTGFGRCGSRRRCS